MMHSTSTPAARRSNGRHAAAARWAGGPMAMMKGEKPRDFKGTLNKLIQYLGRYRALILLVWLFAIASTVASIVGPKILGKATTKLFEGVMAQIAGTGRSILPISATSSLQSCCCTCFRPCLRISRAGSCPMWR